MISDNLAFVIYSFVALGMLIVAVFTAFRQILWVDRVGDVPEEELGPDTSKTGEPLVGLGCLRNFLGFGRNFDGRR